jgi:amino acid transporter
MSNDTSDDEQTLRRLGYAQELARRMSGFSNFAISLSIICILAGGVTSFHLGFCSVGGASIGLGWPLVCLFSLTVALTMGQVASAFPTAGGIYHWAAILGGRGWGWAAAWFNLVGLVVVLAAINVGTYEFLVRSLGARLGLPAESDLAKIGGVLLITLSQALFNHLAVRATTRLIDFSGYWILFVSAALTVAVVAYAPELRFERLVEFTNYSGSAGGDVWPSTTQLWWLFALGFLLPAYTITGFDASAHTSEETISASRNVPRGIVRSVLVSGLFGWVMLSAVICAAPDLPAATAAGPGAFCKLVNDTLPGGLAAAFYAGILAAQYLCGLATVTSASRMAYAFARDGGLPASPWLKQVSAVYHVPAYAIWAVAIGAVLFTISTRVYSTISAACSIFLYISYVLPTLLGFFAYGRTWKQMGEWDIGLWYRPLAFLSVAGCAVLVVIGMWPPNELNVVIVLGFALALVIGWFGSERKRFRGPPKIRSELRQRIEGDSE